MTCYIDTFSGVAGDMLFSALLDASPSGAEALLSEVKGYLHSVEEIAGEWDIELKSVTRSDGMVHKISTVIRRTVVVRKTFLARSPGALKQIVLGLRASRRVRHCSLCRKTLGDQLQYVAHQAKHC